MTRLQPDGARRRRLPTLGIRYLVSCALLAIGPRRRAVAVLVGLSVVSGLLETLLLYMIAKVALTATSDQSSSSQLDLGHLGVDTVSSALTLGALILAFIIALSLPVSSLTASLCASTFTRARKRLIGAHLKASWQGRVKRDEGHLQELVGVYCARLESLVQHFTTVIVAGTALVIIAISAVIVAPLASISGFLLLGAITIPLRPLMGAVRQKSSAFATENGILMSRVAQLVRIDREVAAFDVGEAVEQDLFDRVNDGGEALYRVRFSSRIAPSIYQYIALGLVLLILVVLTIVGSGAAGSIGAIVLLLLRAIGYTRQVQSAIQSGNELAPYVEAIDREVELLTEDRVDPHGADISAFRSIELRSLHYQHSPNQELLSDINLIISEGTAVGLVGPSGGGKTTLANILMGLLEPSSGQVLVNGCDLASFNAERWSRLVALVPQDNQLVRGSIRDNVTFFRSWVTEDAVRAACEDAQLRADIEALPLGLDTEVGPGARDLSGGQRQRLGIARALAGAPQLLLMDEPTSALDPRSERLVRDTLAALHGKVTMVVIAHRPDTLTVCDEIYEVANHTLIAVDRRRASADLARWVGEARGPQVESW